MNMNRLITMVVRQLMNIGMRKGMQMASKGRAKTGGPGHDMAGQTRKAKQGAKIARRIMR
ncbi:hypothetical protein [Yoonia sp.]|uniref:hypothetical protein n=1 Tax=Yoonia sp. TaxID=2212373 RepID=UPI00391C6735